MRYIPLVLLMFVSAVHAQTSGGIAQSGHFQRHITDPCLGACPGCGGMKCGDAEAASDIVACDAAGTCKATAIVAGCPDNDDLMWCLKLKANSDVIPLPDGRLQFIPNDAMIAYVRELDRRNAHGCWGSWDDPKCP